MHKYKVGDVVQILDTKNNCDRHNNMPDIYPKPYTMGVVKDMDSSPIIHLYINYRCSGNDSDTWWYLSNCVRYIPRKELRAMIACYTLYKRSTWFSVRDFYDKVSTNKKVTEDAIKYEMELCKGGDYRILAGNCQHFTAAFMAPGNVLYVKTYTREYIIDVDFIENYLESTKK